MPGARAGRPQSVASGPRGLATPHTSPDPRRHGQQFNLNIRRVEPGLKFIPSAQQLRRGRHANYPRHKCKLDKRADLDLILHQLLLLRFVNLHKASSALKGRVEKCVVFSQFYSPHFEVTFEIRGTYV